MHLALPQEHNEFLLKNTHLAQSKSYGCLKTSAYKFCSNLLEAFHIILKVILGLVVPRTLLGWFVNIFFICEKLQTSFINATLECRTQFNDKGPTKS